ncbi:MAG: hypothetical protein KAJ92_01615 [Gammaproteobacteria bacterium]|nr:hypothetical protein [Gammaproteobacteria bacterium]MCK5262345.1 hypothetical protein [Gammaproteobacteria bacterium]
MPYYVYKMSAQEGMSLVKNLELMGQSDSFKEAKNMARDIRHKQDGGEAVTVKVMFADNQLMAEEQLLEHREKPILMEHEK